MTYLIEKVDKTIKEKKIKVFKDYDITKKKKNFYELYGEF